MLSARKTLAFKLAARAKKIHTSPACAGHGPGEVYWGYEKAAGREIVGYGTTGQPEYMDRVDMPYPSVRFRKDEGEIVQLREKEKNDWKNLSIDEKKALYRASFCKTFAEYHAPDGQWKVIGGIVMLGVSAAIWASWWIHKNVSPDLPISFSEEWREKMLENMIHLKAEPITGYASKWDYEKGRWKA